MARARGGAVACFGVALAATLGCAAQAQVTPLTPGTYRVECKSSLAVCLRPVEELCRAYGYDVVAATERRNNVEHDPEQYDWVTASATVRCRQAVPLFGGDPNAPVPPPGSAAAPAATVPPAAAPPPAVPVPAATVPPAVPAATAPAPSAPAAAPSTPPPAAPSSPVAP